MAKHATLTKKGQITIPAAFRKKYGIGAQDKVVFEDKGDFLAVRPVRKSDFFDLYGSVETGGLAGEEAQNKARSETARDISREGL